MDTILRMYFLFEVINLKNVWKTMDNISKRENGHLKWTVPCLLAATLGFISLLRLRLSEQYKVFCSQRWTILL